MPVVSMFYGIILMLWFVDTRRWGSEVFHRIFKTGCRTEDRLLDTVERLEACRALDLVVAWRLFHLTMAGRQTPQLDCHGFLEDAE